MQWLSGIWEVLGVRFHSPVRGLKHWRLVAAAVTAHLDKPV